MMAMVALRSLNTTAWAWTVPIPSCSRLLPPGTSLPWLRLLYLLQVNKFVRGTASTFAPRASGATGKNPAYPGKARLQWCDHWLAHHHVLHSSDQCRTFSSHSTEASPLQREQAFLWLSAGSTLYTVFEVQAWVALVVSAAAVPATYLHTAGPSGHSAAVHARTVVACPCCMLGVNHACQPLGAPAGRGFLIIQPDTAFR